MSKQTRTSRIHVQNNDKEPYRKDKPKELQKILCRDQPLARKASKSCWRILIMRSAIAFNSIVQSLYKSLKEE